MIVLSVFLAAAEGSFLCRIMSREFSSLRRLRTCKPKGIFLRDKHFRLFDRAFEGKTSTLSRSICDGVLPTNEPRKGKRPKRVSARYGGAARILSVCLESGMARRFRRVQPLRRRSENFQRS